MTCSEAGLRSTAATRLRRLAGRRLPAGLALTSAAAMLAACGHGGAPGRPAAGATAAASRTLVRIVRAPKSLLAAAGPQANGTMWALAGGPSTGLFELDSSSGQVRDSVSVSNAARSVAESTAGVIGLALGTSRSGALELLDGRTARAIATVALPAPAREVVAGSGTTFYVLTGWQKSASVTVVNSRSGQVDGSVPVPPDTVSIVPDIQRASLYVLQKTGLVDLIAIASGRITARFSVGDAGISIALNPAGNTLYVLKGAAGVRNIAVVNAATEGIHRVLPAPSHCLGLLVSASGSQLYEVVGTPGYGNIQVFAL